MSEQSLQIVEPATVAVTLPTKVEMDETISRATAMATSLKKIIVEQRLGVKIGQGEHIRIEAWKTVARFCGYVVRTEALPNDGDGAKARASVIRLADGMVVSTADAECGTEGDDTWIAKPHFQQASMAQTRASGKAFRNVLDWIVTLAGYDATPAEEMVRDDRPTRATPRVTGLKPWCEEHETEFFKRGNMRSYAHPLDEGGWHNKPGEEDDRTEEVGTPAMLFASAGDFLTAAHKRWGRNPHEACQALGVETVNDITEFPASWAKLEAAWG